MENSKYRIRTTRQSALKPELPFKKGASLIGATAILTSALLPGCAAKVTAAEMNGQAATTLNQQTWSTISESMALNSFVDVIGNQAQMVASANDLYASVMIAQAILESGWGTSGLSQAPHYNLYGIKWSGSGAYSEWPTKEFFNGKWVTIKDKFQKYGSYTESLQGNASLLRNRVFQSGIHYYSGTWRSKTNSYREATAWLTGRYATDPSYGSKLNAIIISQNLTRFDTAGSGQPMGSVAASTSAGYTVAASDSLFSIARQHGTTVATLKSWNNLPNDVIYVGQKLVVAGSGTNKPTATGAGSHTVSAGETLSSIARQYGLSVAQIRTQNNLSSETISVGQLLAIGESASASGASTHSSHRVGQGETLYSVARKYGVDVADLTSWNGLAGESIQAGQLLTIQGAASPRATGSGASSSHTVTTGETLSSIGRTHGVSVADLNAWNGLSSSNISEGQVLTVKKGDQTYKVVSGDTLWSIANQHDVSVDQVTSWNNLSNQSVSVGQKLRVG